MNEAMKNLKSMFENSRSRKDMYMYLCSELGEEPNKEVLKNIDEDDFVENELVGNTTNPVKYELIDINKITSKFANEIVKISTNREARMLCDMYQQIQGIRIDLEGKLRSINQEYDPDVKDNRKDHVGALEMTHAWFFTMENNIKKILSEYSSKNELSRWAKSVTGIGPVFATQLSAYLKVTRPTMHAGNFWSYAGLNDNNKPWLSSDNARDVVNRILEESGKKDIDDEIVAKICAATNWSYDHLSKYGRTDSVFGKKKEDKNKPTPIPCGAWSKKNIIKAISIIPYNKTLKMIMWRIGHSFTLVQNKPNSLYGKLLKERYVYEVAKNERGDYAEQAAEELKRMKNKNTNSYKAYSSGKLPDSHLKARAQRYAEKVFLSHYFEAAYIYEYGQMPSEPYAIGSHLNEFGEEVPFVYGHTDYIEPEVSYDSLYIAHKMKELNE